MRAARETPLEMACCHVRESNARVQRQHALVIRVQSDDALHTAAESLLAILEDALQQHNAYLARLEVER